MFQGFEDHGKFYFHESGLRPGGDQYYVFTEQLFNISQLNSLIEFALTGCISLNDGELIDSYNFNQFCCNYYVPLKEGIISKIKGLEEVKKLPAEKKYFRGLYCIF